MSGLRGIAPRRAPALIKEPVRLVKGPAEIVERGGLYLKGVTTDCLIHGWWSFHLIAVGGIGRGMDGA